VDYYSHVLGFYGVYGGVCGGEQLGDVCGDEAVDWYVYVLHSPFSDDLSGVWKLRIG
jgi:hypothetical protein